MKYLQILAIPFKAIWYYFKDMNSENKENGGGVSIKRNISFVIAALVIVVQLYSLRRLPCDSEKNMDFFTNICKWYVTVDMLFVLLALGITSVEKLTDLAQKLKFGVISKPTPECQSEEVEDKNSN